VWCLSSGTRLRGGGSPSGEMLFHSKERIYKREDVDDDEEIGQYCTRAKMGEAKARLRGQKTNDHGFNRKSKKAQGLSVRSFLIQGS